MHEVGHEVGHEVRHETLLHLYFNIMFLKLLLEARNVSMQCFVFIAKTERKGGEVRLISVELIQLEKSSVSFSSHR